MRSTTTFEAPCEKYAISTPELMKALSCGRSTAVKIGTAAGARVKFGKRILWNIEKVKAYLDSIAE